MIRRARLDDVDAIAEVFRESRAEAMPWLPVLHVPDEDRVHFGRRVAEQEVWVAREDGRVVGFASLGEAWLDDLYVAPAFQRRGIGDALFTQAQRSMPDGFRFWVFQANHRARRFYEARGATVLELTDGGKNEERMSDALYEWRPPAAAEFSVS